MDALETPTLTSKYYPILQTQIYIPAPSDFPLDAPSTF
jgi:hypothetical protein